jgi:ELWxxDGT repeat protein
MNSFFSVLFIFCCLGWLNVYAQSPLMVKTVSGTTTEPSAKNQTLWQNNGWNGLFFYQGKGSPAKLSVTDGTNAGTIFLADLGNAETITHIIPAQDFVYVLASRIASISPFTVEFQIWKSNGTTSGTSLIYTLPVAPFTSAPSFTSDRDDLRNFSISGNTMYFKGYSVAEGNELWVTDGTNAGTKMVKDIKPGTGSGAPLAFCKVGNEIFFTANAVGLERKLWKTNGTEEGTVQVAVPEPFFILDNAVGLVNNKMIFYAHNTSDGYEPYVSDGTGQGTFMLKNINAAGNSWINQSQNAHLRFNNKYCFFIANNGNANALWRTDGTASGTIQLTADALNVSSGVSGGSYTDIDNDGIWLIQYNSIGSGNAEKLYRSNGTVEGTILAASDLSYAQHLKIYNKELWMASRDIGSPANVEPWRSDGTPAKTMLAFEIAPGIASSNPFGFFVKDSKLFFFASIGSSMNLYQYGSSAPDYTFNGSVPGANWNDGANWNSQTIPGITDTVYIPAGKQPVINGVSAKVARLVMGDGAKIQLTNATDTLLITHSLLNAGANEFMGNGILTFKSPNMAPTLITGGFTAAKIAFFGNIILPADPILIKN